MTTPADLLAVQRPHATSGREVDPPTTRRQSDPAPTLLLQRHRSQLKVVPAQSLAQLTALPPALLAQARLLAFASPLVVPVCGGVEKSAT